MNFILLTARFNQIRLKRTELHHNIVLNNHETRALKYILSWTYFNRSASTVSDAVGLMEMEIKTTLKYMKMILEQGQVGQ